MTNKRNDQISEEIEKVVKSKVESALKRGFNMQYAETLKERIKERTRRGSGIDPDTGATKRIEKLTPKYKKVRKRNQSRLSGETTPARSNLTATGQLLNSLTVVKIKLKNSVSYMFRLGDRRGRDITGRSSKIGNKKLNEYLESGYTTKSGSKVEPRKWLGFTKSQRNEIVKEIRQIIKNFLR